MKDYKVEDRKATELELRARKELLKRLEHPMKLLAAAATKEQDKRRERIETVRQYKTVAEVQDVYGYDLITDDERRALIDAIEFGDELIESATASSVEIAFNILRDITGRLSRELRSFEFDLLPLEQQTEILKKNDERREEMEARRAARRPGATT